MDLASLSLGQIASLLSPMQQEVLLASISVAASFIQQIQREEQEYSQNQSNSNQNNLTTNTSTYDEEDDDEDDDENDEDINDDIHHDLNHINHSNHHSLNNSKDVKEVKHSEQEGDPNDLLTIRLFAEELKQRRKSIRLSQKGAAQSLRAFTGGAQPCTDAIIYHFENLQLEPERAMQLIPLLKDWLEWAEKHRLNGKQLPMMSAVTKVPRERKRKVVLFNEKAKHYLEDAFAKNNHPDRYQLDVISEELNIPTRSIRKWFTNRRQRKRFAEKFHAAGNTSSTSI